MIKVSVLYPNTPGARFDMQYYRNKHMRLVRAKLEPALKGVEIGQGVGGAAPGTPAPYVVLCHLAFDSMAAFEQAFGPNAAAILGDIPNYTDIEPVVQISEVKMD